MHHPTQNHLQVHAVSSQNQQQWITLAAELPETLKVMNKVRSKASYIQKSIQRRVKSMMQQRGKGKKKRRVLFLHQLLPTQVIKTEKSRN
jgi:hypothetical protein